MHLLALLMATGDSGNTGVPQIDTFLPYLNYGLLAVVLYSVLRRVFVVPKWVLDDKTEEMRTALDAQKTAHESALATQKAASDAIIAQLTGQLAQKDDDIRELKVTNNQLQDLTRERLLPALIDSTRLAQLYVDELQRRGRSGG